MNRAANVTFAVLVSLLATARTAHPQERISVPIPPGPEFVLTECGSFNVPAGGMNVHFEGGCRSQLCVRGDCFGTVGASNETSRNGIRIGFSGAVKDVRFTFYYGQFQVAHRINGASIWNFIPVLTPFITEVVYPPETSSLDLDVVPLTAWGYYMHIGRLSFVPVAASGDANPVAPGSSPIKPPDATDLRVVADSGGNLDTGCRFRSDGRILFEIPIKRVVGPTDSAGNLLTAESLIKAGYLSATARLSVMAWDVDPEERDGVYFNGQFAGLLKGSNNQWSETTFTIPTDRLRFGSSLADTVNFEGVNTVWIEIDQTADSGKRWCTAVDWAVLRFDAIAPLFLVHGTASGPDTWEGEIVDHLRWIGVPFTHRIQLEGNGSIALNGELLADKLRSLGSGFGTREAHLVAHSKGGNDSREFLGRHHTPAYARGLKVRSLFTLSTPFHGSILSDIIKTARENRSDESTNAAIERLVSVAFLIPVRDDALRDNTTVWMDQYNKTHPFPSGFKFYNFAADADLNNDRKISFPERSGQLPDFIFLNNLLTEVAEAAYLALGTVRSVKVDYRHIVARGLPVRIPLVEVDQYNPNFLENDFVVTVQSARHPKATFLRQIDANHSTMKSRDVITEVLSRIQGDFPVRLNP